MKLLSEITPECKTKHRLPFSLLDLLILTARINIWWLAVQVGAPVSILATGQAYRIIADASKLKIKWTGKAASTVSDFSSQIPEVSHLKSIMLPTSTC